MSAIAPDHANLRVLFLAPHEPWCRENGSSVVIADLLEGLARTPGVDLYPVFLRHPPNGDVPDHLRALSGDTIGIKGFPKWVAVLAGAARGTFPLRTRFAVGPASRRILRRLAVRGVSPTVVHVEHLPLLDLGARLARAHGCPLVYRAHNIESLLWARRLHARGVLGRAVVRRLGRSEADAIRACQLTLCISPGDLDWVRSNVPSVSADLLPCSLLLVRYDAIPNTEPSDDAQICFVGGLDWGPNASGLRWFMEAVMPRILERVPHARLTVLARGAAERPWIAEHPAVRLLPPAWSALSLYAASQVSIAPLLEGGGVRIKIPESLAVGCPVVATSIGAEGLDLPGLTRTDDPAEFAAACVHHLTVPREPGLRARLRAAVDAHHGATAVAARLVSYWHELAAVGGAPQGLREHRGPTPATTG